LLARWRLPAIEFSTVRASTPRTSAKAELALGVCGAALRRWQGSLPISNSLGVRRGAPPRAGAATMLQRLGSRSTGNSSRLTRSAACMGTQSLRSSLDPHHPCAVDGRPRPRPENSQPMRACSPQGTAGTARRCCVSTVGGAQPKRLQPAPHARRALKLHCVTLYHSTRESCLPCYGVADSSQRHSSVHGCLRPTPACADECSTHDCGFCSAGEATSQR